jgi:hypothetical protein
MSLVVDTLHKIYNYQQQTHQHQHQLEHLLLQVVQVLQKTYLLVVMQTSKDTFKLAKQVVAQLLFNPQTTEHKRLINH